MGGNGGTCPATIMLIRHGEKPGDPQDDDEGGLDLAPRGAARAVALPTLFMPATPGLACAITSPPSKGSQGFLGTYAPFGGSGPSPRFPLPDAVFATADSKHSHRPKQTARPTAEALGLHLNDEYDDKDKGIDGLASLMWTAPYAGKVVLICWHHGTMDALATQLKATPPGKWPGSVFDMLWRLDYGSGGTPTLQVLGQQLLYGDQEQPGLSA